MKENEANDSYKRAMVVVAHPDDAEYGCSGSVAKWCREGYEVVYVLCTDGSKGSDSKELSTEQLRIIREDEQRNAGKILGLKSVEFLRYPDGYLQPTLDLRRDIARQIRRHRPHTLICMNPVREMSMSTYLGHPDHYASAEAALSAVYPSARDHLTFPELLNDEGLEPWKVSHVWVMAFGVPADRWNPLEEEDVEKSVQALLAHKSQIADPERADKFMRERRKETGKKIGAPYAEGFREFNLR